LGDLTVATSLGKERNQLETVEKGKTTHLSGRPQKELNRLQEFARHEKRAVPEEALGKEQRNKRKPAHPKEDEKGLRGPGEGANGRAVQVRGGRDLKKQEKSQLFRASAQLRYAVPRTAYRDIGEQGVKVRLKEKGLEKEKKGGAYLSVQRTRAGRQQNRKASGVTLQKPGKETKRKKKKKRNLHKKPQKKHHPQKKKTKPPKPKRGRNNPPLRLHVREEKDRGLHGGVSSQHQHTGS